MVINQIVTMKGAKLALIGVALCFFAIHVCLFILFYRFGVTPMMYFNIGSMVFYLASIYLVYREWLKLAVSAMYLEVLVHMVLAVCFVGWNSGFQTTLVGIVSLIFFAEYVGRIMQVDHVHALSWSVLGMLGYVGSYVFTSFNVPMYSLPENIEFFMQVAWGVIVFVIVTACLQAFVMLTFRSELSLATQAVHDELTGLPNRYYMTDYLNKLAESVRSGEVQSAWLAMLDIDDFKMINDTYGHNCGDAVLRRLAELIKDCVQDAEVCRWGGEEFLIVGVVTNSMDEIAGLCDRLRMAVAEHVFWYQETRIHLTVTIGVTELDPNQSVLEWVNAADKRLYAGKTSGKNLVSR